MNVPESIVVYYYYAHYAVYFDGRFAGRYTDRFTAQSLAKLIGIPFEQRDVNWEDWPAQRLVGASRSLDVPQPERLADVEKHFADLAARRRRERIESLRAELARLETEAAPDAP